MDAPGSFFMPSIIAFVSSPLAPRQWMIIADIVVTRGLLMRMPPQTWRKRLASSKIIDLGRLKALTHAPRTAHARRRGKSVAQRGHGSVWCRDDSDVCLQCRGT